MSWRFRKSFKVIPGVKLNLTSRGLSATFGAAPFSINVGPKGVYRNVSIPGTGIWDRQRIGGPSTHPANELSPVPEPGVPSVSPVPPLVVPATEIHSASTELLTSESLEQLRRLLTDAHQERDELTREVSSALDESNTATTRYESWERGFVLKRLFKNSFAKRKEAAETAAAKLDELQEQLRLTTIATEINVDREQAEPYYRMRDAFAALSESQRIWNELAERAIDRIVERSRADTLVTRTPVSFSLKACDLIQWEQQVPHLPNRTGGDMYVYPGFILYRASRQAFALIDSREVILRFVSTQFTENETVPSDSQIIGHTWAKCNKDGTPDRRFRDNYQIPVAHYGTLLFSTRDGLDVRYLCSNATLAEKFARTWTAFHQSFGRSANPTDEETDASSRLQDPETVVERCKSANAAFSSALKEFKVASDAFLLPFQKASEGVDPSDGPVNLSLPRELFTGYKAAVQSLMKAAREHVAAMEAALNLFGADRINAVEEASSARAAIEVLVQAWAEVEQGIQSGHLDVNPFVNACTSLFGTITQLEIRVETVVRGAGKGRRRGQKAQ